MIDEWYLQKIMRTVSHNMGGTLRTSVGFSTLILDNLKDQLDEKTIMWLEMIKTEGEKTQAELIALSRYARLYGLESSRNTCSLKDLCEKSITISRINEFYPDFEIKVGELPTIEAIESLWVDYFVELIGNSARFSGGMPSNFCHIYSESNEKTVSIIIEDNGIGLSKKQKEEALLPFKTLEGAGKPGVGIGLSMAKRIIEIHDGEFLLADNNPGLKVVAIFQKTDQRFE